MPKRRGRGDGSIEELPSGSFRAVLTARTHFGKKDRLSETFHTKTAAADWLAEKRNERRNGRLAVTTKTLAEYLDEWLKRRLPTVQPKTAEFYSGQVARLTSAALAALPLRKLTRPAIEADVPNWGKVDQQRKALDVLRIVLNDAVEDGLIPSSPARKARKPIAAPKRVSYWTAEEARRVLAAAAGTHLEAYWWLAMDGGFRPGELLGLHWPEVDTVAGTVKVIRTLEDVGGELRLKDPKTTAGRRTVRIGRGTCAALERHRARMMEAKRDTIAGPVFVGQRKGQLLTHSTFYSRYYLPVLKAAGVPKRRPYDTRHTSATLLLAAGVSIKVVSERLGHTDISTTLRHYAHCLPDAQETAARAADSILIAPRTSHAGTGQAITSS